MVQTEKLSDEELVVLVREKDQELYADLVGRYQDKLLRYATRLIGDEHKALDAVQEAFIKAFVNLNGFNVNKKFSSWIYRIVHNEAINHAKKNSKEISLESNEWVHNIVKVEDDLSMKIDRKEAVRLLQEFLFELPLKYRSPLILFYMHDKQYEEISDVLRMPVSTVGTRINRGKKLLKALCIGGGENYE
jgi:RNA polymerase sigma-70 factor (ECF subfamily)